MKKFPSFGGEVGEKPGAWRGWAANGQARPGLGSLIQFFQQQMIPELMLLALGAEGLDFEHKRVFALPLTL